MLSVVLLCSSLITFIAANWDGITIFHRFLLVQGVIVFTSALCLSLFFNSRINPKTVKVQWGKFALIFIIISALGALYALIGQTYQTGADAWQLFFLWSFLSLPFAIYINSSLIWFYFLVIINTTWVLMTQQIYALEFLGSLLPASFCFMLYLILFHGLKNTQWVTQFLLFFSFGFVYYHFIINEFFNENFYILLLLLIIGSAKLGSHLQKEPISFIQQTFFIIVIVNTKIFVEVFIFNNESTLNFLIFTLSLLISSTLFFCYLRMVYNNWNTHNTFLTEHTRQTANMIKNICLGFLGWSIALSSVFLVESILTDMPDIIKILSIAMLFVVIIYVQKKIFSTSILNQFGFALLFSFLQIYLFNLVSRHTGRYEHSLDSEHLALLMNVLNYCTIILPYLIYYVLIKHKYSRIIIGTFAISQLLHEYYQIDDPFFCIIITVMLTVYLIKDKFTFKTPLFKTLQQALYSEMFLILFYALSFLLILKYQRLIWRDAFDGMYHAMPFIALSLITLSNRLPKYLIIIGLLLSLWSFYFNGGWLFSLWDYYFQEYSYSNKFNDFIWLPFALTVIIIASFSSSKFHKVFSWVFVFTLLYMNYYDLHTLLIIKSKTLLITGLILTIVTILMVSLHKLNVNKHFKNQSFLDEGNRLASMHPNNEIEKAEFAKLKEKTTRIAFWINHFISHRRSRLLFFSSGLILSLGIANKTIYDYERIINTGQTIRFEITPRDPRSLIQGDYMVLNYVLETQVNEANRMLKLEESLKEKDSIILTIDPKTNVVFLAYPLQKDKIPLQAKEIETPLNYNGYNYTLKLPHSYFFDEMTELNYSVARYAEFKVSPEGKFILSALLDKDFNTIK